MILPKDKVEVEKALAKQPACESATSSEVACLTAHPVLWDVVYAKPTCAGDHRVGQASFPGRFPQLDSLRGLAAVLVALHHFGLMGHTSREPIVNLSPHGSVPLFFLLSGLVLAIPYLKGKQGTYSAFLIRRILRVYCPYLCGLALSVAGAMLFHHDPGWGEWADHTWSRPISGALVLWHVLLIGNYDSGQYNTAFWTLVQEMRISLFFPVLFLATNRLRTRWALLAACLCSLGSQWIQTHSRFEATLITLKYVPIFICGILLAKNLGQLNIWYQKLRPLQLILYVTSSVVLFSEGHLLQEANAPGMWRLGDWPTVLGSAGVILISLNSSRVQRFLASPVPTWLGRVSYSLYLVHGTVLFSFAALRWGGLPSALHLPAFLTASLLLATGFSTVIDEPFARMARAVGKSSRPLAWALVTQGNLSSVAPA